MSARDDILASIRRSLGVTGAESIRAGIVDERLERAPRGVTVARGQVDLPARLALFSQKATTAAATVETVRDPAEIPARIAEYLRGLNLPARLRRGDDPRLAALPWADTSLDVSIGRSSGDDLTAVSHAAAAVAETGTIVMTSGADNPTTLNFLPDNHVVVVEGGDVAGDFEGVWALIRRAHGKGQMPRTVNFITGPSRSGDIEQTLLLGAHGPRRLHVIVVER